MLECKKQAENLYIKNKKKKKCCPDTKVLQLIAKYTNHYK